MKKMNPLVFSFVILSLLAISCSDDKKPTAPSNAKILSINPTIGAIGTPIVIEGNGFIKDISKIEVRFNGASAAVDSVNISSSINKIFTRVPAGASTGKVSVKIYDKMLESPHNFVVLSSHTSLLPANSGNYWVYVRFGLDDNNIPNTEPGIDSLFAAGTVTKLDKLSNMLSTFTKVKASDNYTPAPDQFYYEEGANLFTHSSWFDDLMNVGGMGMQLPFTIEEQWLKLLDRNATDWTIFTRNFANEPLSFGALNGELKLTGKNLGTSSLLVNGINYSNVVQVSIKFSFVGSVNSQLGMIPLNLERELIKWYAPSVGRVKSKMLSMRFYIENLADQVIPGFELNLIDSKVQ